MVLSLLAGASVLLTQNPIDASAQLRYTSGTEFENGISARSLGFAEKELMSLEAAAWREALTDENRHQPTSLDELAQKLKDTTNRLLTNKSATQDAKAYLLTYVVGSWVISNMSYIDVGEGISQVGRDPNGDPIALEKRGSWINVNELLRSTKLEGACRHSAVLTRELINTAGRDINVKAYYLGGWARGISAALPTNHPPSHAWNFVVLPSGMRVVFDATGSSRTRNELRNRCKIFYPSPEPWKFIPRSREELENFLSFRYGSMVNGWFDPADARGVATRNLAKLRRDPRQCLFMQHMSLAEWLAIDNHYLKPINDLIFREASQRARGLK